MLGGRGYYGARVVEALSAVGEAVAGSRNPGLQGVAIDLSRPDTFGALDGWDVVVNAADAVGAPPDDAMRHVLASGGLFVDLSADPVGLERALALGDTTERPTGTIVLGAGVFPGLSTAMAAEIGRRARRVQLGVRLSPFSVAGPGNVALMMASLDLPVGPAAPMPFLGAGSVQALSTVLGDAPLIRSLAPDAEVETRLAVVPGILRFNVALLAWLLAHAGPLRGLLATVSRVSLSWLRVGLFRNAGTAVELTVVADGGTEGKQRLLARVADGHAAMAVGAAAAVALVLRRRPPPGVYVAGVLLDLDLLVAKMGELGVDVELSSE